MCRVHPRILRTKKKLADALASLTLERGYENLSVTAVRIRAKVGQATFYRHYKSVDELLTDVMQSAMREIAEIIDQQETLYDEGVAALSYFLTHRSKARLYFGLPKDHPIRGIVKEQMVELIVKRYRVREASPVPPEVWANHTVESLLAFLEMHLDSIDVYSPEEITAYFFELILSAAEPIEPKARID